MPARRSVASLVLFVPILGWLFAGALLAQTQPSSPPQPSASATLPSGSTPAAAGQGRFLVLSDVHFNPYEPELFERLKQAKVEKWPEILAAAPTQGQKLGSDSSYALVRSVVDDAARRVPDPDFILCPGDFLAHNWQETFDRLAHGVRSQQPEVFRQFTMNSVALIVAELRQRFPGVPILPAVGNEDSFCQDYGLEPGGEFLRDFAQAWRPLLHLPAEQQQAFERTFRRGGYYDVPLPRTPGHRLIVLNSVFFSTEYFDACQQPHQQRSGEQLAWLAQRLRAAEEANQRVWLLMHIPPGIDVYDTAKRLAKNEPVQTFWHNEYASEFLKLADRYRRTLQWAFAGHTHMDDFRAPLVAGQVAVPFKLVPAVSPVFGNNPAYQAYTYRRDDGQIEDYQAYYLPLAGQRDSDMLPAWRPEYSFRQAYEAGPLTAESLVTLSRTLQTQPRLRQRFLTWYNASAPLDAAPNFWPVVSAAMFEALPEPFLKRLRNLPHE